jgi:hypothetical protein
MRMPLGIVALCFQRHGGPNSQSFPHLLLSSSVHLLFCQKVGAYTLPIHRKDSRGQGTLAYKASTLPAPLFPS